MKIGNNDPSKSMSWKVLETVLGHLNTTEIHIQLVCDQTIHNDHFDEKSSKNVLMHLFFCFALLNYIVFTKCLSIVHSL